MIEENEMNGYAATRSNDQYNPVSVERIARPLSTRSCAELGEDPEREGLEKTPERVAKALQFLTHGNDLDPAEILRSAMFREEYQQMVIVKDIEVYSLCEHHILPFFGKAHVAYIPERPHRRPVEDPARGGRVRAAPAGAGAAYRRDPQLHREHAETDRASRW